MPHRFGDAFKTLLQVVASACGIVFLSMIAHKAITDLTTLAAAQAGAELWPALARYPLRNLAGGG